ncbi:hypothetical protein ACIBG7_08200 [Nonomuraea sp. NPDC050328]
MHDWSLADDHDVEARCAAFRQAKLALDRGVSLEVLLGQPPGGEMS